VLDGRLGTELARERRDRGGTAGAVLTVPAETVHAVRNVGPGNSAELATNVVPKGEPFLVVVE
jgi:hypothetical protein